MGLLFTLLIALVIGLVGKYLIDLLATDYDQRKIGYVILAIAILLYVLGFLRF